MPLLTQNRELKPHNIWNWTIPAWFTRRTDGTLFKTCPSAGICAKLCYARNGTYLFRNVQAAHNRNLELVLTDIAEWRRLMYGELKTRMKPKPRALPEGVSALDLDAFMASWVMSGLPAVRIHDAGDFFAPWYLTLWLEVAADHPHLLFYAYTKEVAMFREQAAHGFPDNFRYLFSTGGTQDASLTLDDRHADVFPTREALDRSGYRSQDSCDLLAIMLPTNLIGITANNIRHFNKRMAGRTFGQIQQEVTVRGR
jgi:hypothetical protein